ncbi:hypothetical protein ACIRU3_31275 [Streptomyces sp. NPDC101151]|uniref:hypothetical protein n=1 Tax=Streptomyces sp. NPDC101151 TaxID=3366115 RepID=UPI00381F213D
MKKRSMLAIATLATGFVVAAVTPSHAVDKGPAGSLGDLNVSGTLDHVDDLAGHDGLVRADHALGQQ